MANDYYMLNPGDPVEHRVADEKFVNPETRDVYNPEDPASKFPDGTAHENIDIIQIMNALKTLLGVGSISPEEESAIFTGNAPLTQDAPNRLLDEPMGTRLLKNLFPPQWARNPLEAKQMMEEGYDEYGTAGQTFPALINYLLQGGEQDPVGPQRMPFSEYMEARPGMVERLNRNKKVEDILRKHVNSLTGTKAKPKNNLNRR